MSIAVLARRLDSSVAYSLYSDDSVVGGAPPFIDAATTQRPSTRATSSLRGDLATDALGSSLERLVVDGLGPDVVAQQVQALPDRREREHGEALEVEGL